MVNGENYGGAWIMDAKGAPTWLPLSSLPGTWDLWEAKNLNGDQFADILLYDDTNKDIGAWLLSASGVPAWQSLGKLSYDSTLITACDLNGDSLTDLVYRKTDGTVGFRFLESSGTDKEIALSNDWQIAGTGDLNGDGIEDILLRNGTKLGAWMMDADANPSWVSVGSIDTAYTVATIADFNGDGTDDIIFNSNGSYGAWMMDNGTASAWRAFDGISSTAVLESTGDYNGDGIDDLRFRDGNTLAVYRVYEDSTRWQVIGDVPSNWRTDLGGLA
jgi:hypothetical protein